MIRPLRLAIVALLLVGTVGGAAEVPRLKSHVNDYAGVLTTMDRLGFEKTLASYEAETRHQVAILTIKSLNGEAIESFSLRVANAWGLGKKGLNNGVLVTFALAERKVRIEVGSDMNRYVPDSVARNIIDDAMLPAFRRGDISNGLRQGVERLLDACRAYKVAVSASS